MSVDVIVELKNKVAVVTGSSRGIGRAIAEGFERAGARVWFHGPDEDAGRRSHYIRADFTKPADVQRMAEVITKAESRLDILVNNAGIEPVMPLDAIDMNKFDACFNVNVRAPMQLTTALLPLLKASGNASILNITSIHQSV